jgi:toxin ParE1/3/4
MKVRYSRRASNDLASIHDYLSGRSPTGAARVLTAIYAAIEFIRRNPHAAEKTNIPDVRVRTVRKYRFKVFYRMMEESAAIEVVHVRHTSRRPWQGE